MGVAASDDGELKPVRLDHIAPDLAMVHLDRHKIKWSDLEMEPQTIGEGFCYHSLFAVLCSFSRRMGPTHLTSHCQVDLDWCTEESIWDSQ